ncbi:DoxX family protein [Flavobacterium amniphilum]|uniref:BT_3928 family protein n=1 Tax=Flavobacterium amniphilum TaxID=1834035 RepID=UPI00202ABB90|nr:BT_3928 family protein [Flavobacterium amniphilum]MCL9806307.1 DoxX family protein [Flavobacterium amniphilum]
MKYLVHFSRLFVGVLFIISGLIKLNDPVGFSYKLDEYFGETVFNMPFLLPFTLAIALFVVILEVILGVMLLVGYKPKFTVWSLLGLILFFTFLTFYSAYFNVVKDCGCFGDALKLTPWESFTKDVVLLVFILVLFFGKNHIQPLFGTKFAAIASLLSIILSCYLGYHVLNHLPVIDFRAYAVTKNIQKGMEIPEGAPKSEYEMKFIYEVNGAKKEFSDKELMNIPPNAKFIERIDKVIKEGYVPPIHDFGLEKDGSDYKDDILNEAKVILFTVYNLDKSNPEGLKLLEAFNQKAKAKGYHVLAVTGSDSTAIEKIKKQYGFTFDFYFCDPTTIKTIERANPSIVVLNKGTVMQKAHYNDIDNINL